MGFWDERRSRNLCLTLEWLLKNTVIVEVEIKCIFHDCELITDCMIVRLEETFGKDQSANRKLEIQHFPVIGWFLSWSWIFNQLLFDFSFRRLDWIFRNISVSVNWRSAGCAGMTEHITVYFPQAIVAPLNVSFSSLVLVLQPMMLLFSLSYPFTQSTYQHLAATEPQISLRRRWRPKRSKKRFFFGNKLFICLISCFCCPLEAKYDRCLCSCCFIGNVICRLFGGCLPVHSCVPPR